MPGRSKVGDSVKTEKMDYAYAIYREKLGEEEGLNLKIEFQEPNNQAESDEDSDKDIPQDLFSTIPADTTVIIEEYPD